MKRSARVVLVLIFAGLLLTPLLIRRFRAVEVIAPTGNTTENPFGFRLTESAKASGLDFVHGAPTLDAKLAHIMPQGAHGGGGVGGGRGSEGF